MRTKKKPLFIALIYIVLYVAILVPNSLNYYIGQDDVLYSMFNLTEKSSGVSPGGYGGFAKEPIIFDVLSLVIFLFSICVVFYALPFDNKISRFGEKVWQKSVKFYYENIEK